ncbi:HAD family phosphatase [Sphingosinicella sp. BN140058]|uniref:HAD family hydrolase n=1 Tax=Sphingosinicella sp. BN140058 TaxID=1892855 RepID=UPI001011F960|nr:HAD family phosphatase [Sphingosinicella sp. BN140058]QAY76484.1 HAD family phosphatase [Sphingosinicella sp. BN140058]
MPILPAPLEAVICDMDGLLLDTEAAHRETMKAAAADLGYDLPEPLFLSMVGVHRPRNRIMLREAFGAEFPLDLFYADSDARFEAILARGVPLRPGLHRLLDTLDRLGLRRAVVTSTASPWAEERLAAAGILDRFETVVTLSDVARPKPAPDPYLKAIDRLGISAGRAVALEDSHSGVRAAAAARLATIMIPDLLGPTAETARLTIATLSSLGDVADLLLAEAVPVES